MAKNDSETSDAKANDVNTGDFSAENQNLRRLSRKRRISASAVESEETVIKKKRQRSSAESNSIIQTAKSLGDLPPEMLEAVLQELPTSDLLNCRRLNQKFNEIASEIMSKRADIELHFSDGNRDGKFMRIIQYRRCPKLLLDKCEPHEKVSSQSLRDLVVCLREAKHFPITSFRFDDLNKFGNEDMGSFLSIWGTNIVALNVSLKDVDSDIGILRDLLVKTVPSLRKLQIIFDSWARTPATIELFADLNQFQLSNLQILRTNIYYKGYRPMIANMLRTAPNLNDFYQYCNNEKFTTRNNCVQNGTTTNDLAMLQTLNKFHCLKDLRIELSEDIIRFLALQRIDFKLESFAVSLQPPQLKSEELKSSATSILNQLFQSCKDVIHTLRIEPLEWLGLDLIIPKMENLRKLELFAKAYGSKDVFNMFSPQFEMAENFPNLKELTVKNHYEDETLIFPTHEQLKPMPSIEVLRIIGSLSAECEEKLLNATPNVTRLLIEENDFDFRTNENPVSINFRLIVNCLPKLQSFGWLITRPTHCDLLHSLDAAVTGLPVEFCEQISKKFQNRDSVTADELASYQLEQRTSSILDFKELKQFDFNFILEHDGRRRNISEEWEGCGRLVSKVDEAGFSPGDVLYKTGFSKVSKFLAFDLLPNLNVRTHRYLD